MKLILIRADTIIYIHILDSLNKYNFRIPDKTIDGTMSNVYLPDKSSMEHKQKESHAIYNFELH